MARTADVLTFDPVLHSRTVESMARRLESTHALGENTFRTTGHLHELVDIRGQVRRSRNAMVRDDDNFILKNGTKFPIINFIDGTGSMAHNLTLALHAMEQLFDMLEFLRDRHQTDVAFGIVQDVIDTHPVVQLGTIESDNRVVERIRQLVPTRGGGDATEDYDLGVFYLDRFIETDIYDFYGLKGLATITGDQIGRGVIRGSDVKRHLGHTIAEQSIDLATVCKNVLRRWHTYYVQVGAGGSDYITRWWQERLGESRVVIVPDANYLAPVWAGLAYITDEERPTMDGFTRIANVGNSKLSQGEISMVWEWLQVAAPNFGAQAKLPGYKDLPYPGDRFAHLRHAFPIGHSRANENITPPEEAAL